MSATGRRHAVACPAERGTGGAQFPPATRINEECGGDEDGKSGIRDRWHGRNRHGDLPAVPAVLVGDLRAFDVVMSDMAPDTTGIRHADQARSEALFERARTDRRAMPLVRRAPCCR